ncbi:MAG: hypothetical protein GX986_04420 [Firmicutes bacterium]|nr:hypothetical protein [Bacillota bacterium]
MKGIGKTVAVGTTIEEFQVEILGVLAGQETVKHLVLVQVSGDVIERMGGIASGMSGSPVYINGRLLGAISYTFDLTDHRLGMVTPIGPMLDLLHLKKDVTAWQPSTGTWHWADGEGDNQGDTRMVANHLVKRVSIATPQGDKSQALYADGHLQITPAATPLLVGGMDDRARQRLAAFLEPLGMSIMAVTGTSAGAIDGESKTTAKIEPGSAFGVQLVQGDVGVMALGTVTYRDNNDFVGFGHPFMNRGAVDLFVSTAYIYTTVNSLSMPFKLGVPMDVVGSLTQDRGAGVAGHLGRLPSTVDLKVKVTDKDLATTREFRAQVANDPGLMVSLVSAAALQGIDQGIDRIGSGTSRIVYQISGQGLPQPLVRDNMFFSPIDISAVSLAEVLETLQLLNDNEFQAIKLDSVEITAQIEGARRTAFIEKATPTVAEALPGEMVDVEVVIRPYRGQRETKILKLAIPETAERGVIHVTVRGGGMGYLFPEITPFHDIAHQETKKTDMDVSMEPPTSADSLEKLLETVLEREKHHEIVMEYIPYYDTYVIEPLPMPGSSETDKESGASAGDEQANGQPSADNGNGSKAESGKYNPWNEDGTEPVRVTLPTRYVIEGQTSFEITVRGRDEGPFDDLDLEGDEEQDYEDESESEFQGELTDEGNSFFFW